MAVCCSFEDGQAGARPRRGLVVREVPRRWARKRATAGSWGRAGSLPAIAGTVDPERPQRLEAGVDGGVVVRVPRLEALAALGAQPGQSGSHSGAIGSTRLIASITSGRRSSSWWSVRRVVSGSSSSSRTTASRSPRSIDGRISSSMLAVTGVTSGRRQRAHSPAIAVVRRAVATRPRFVRRQAQRAGDGLGQDDAVAGIHVDRVDRVLADGAGRLGHEAGKREDERVADRIDGMRRDRDRTRLIAGRRPEPPPRRRSWPASRAAGRRRSRRRCRPPGRGRRDGRRASRSPARCCAASA